MEVRPMSTHAVYPRLAHQHVHHRDPQAAAMALQDDEKRQARAAARRSVHWAEVHAAGRGAIAVLFLASAIVKLIHFDDTRKAMDAFGFSGSDLILAFAIGVELVGGMCLALGYHTRRAALALAAYLAVLTTVVCHDLTAETTRAVVVATLG